MANPERMNLGNDEDFNSFLNNPDSDQPLGENYETLDRDRVRKIGQIALQRYNLLTPKLEEQLDAQHRTSESYANLYDEKKESGSPRHERIAILEREIESIGAEIANLEQQLALARAALDEMEGRPAADTTPEPASSSAEPESSENTESAENAEATPNSEETPAVDYKVLRTKDGQQVYSFDDDTMVVMPDLDEIADLTDQDLQKPLEEWEKPVEGEEAERVNEATEETSDKMKKSSRLKKALAGFGLGAILLTGILGGPVGQAFTSRANAEPAQNPAMEQVVDGIPQFDSYEEMNAVFDYDSAYTLPGLLTSPNKPNPASFACGDEVREICENDDIRSAEYVMQVREYMAAWVAGNFPDQLKHPGDVGIDNKIELAELYDSLSNEEQDARYQHYCDVLEHNVRVEHTTVTGTFNNTYEYVKDSTGPLNHQNVELGLSVTEENNTPVTIYVLLDDNGNEIGRVMVKDSCENVIDEKGTNEKAYEGMKEINPDQPQNFDSGSETTGDEGTRGEDTGDEGTGTENEGTGNEGTSNEGTGGEGTSDETTDWGKEGDPHGGDLVDPSGPVDPNSEVSKEENDATNEGNRGYVDDNKAAPGDSSNNNGVRNDGYADSGITAPSATTNGDRLTGGTNQGGKELNGENVQQNQEAIERGQQQDRTGDDAQRAAQKPSGEDGGGLTPGGNNLTNEGEESAVRGGKF